MLAQRVDQPEQMVGTGPLEAVVVTAQGRHNVRQKAGGTAEAAILQRRRAQAVEGLCQPHLSVSRHLGSFSSSRRNLDSSAALDNPKAVQEKGSKFVKPINTGMKFYFKK